MEKEKTDIKSQTLPELKEMLAAMGEKSFRAGQIFSWLHEKRVLSFDDMTDLSRQLRESLKEKCFIEKLTVACEKISKEDDTRKYLFRLRDKNVIEGVLMKYEYGWSVCISTQVGCRMGCSFCASTMDGLARSLSAAEMLEEVYCMEALVPGRVSHVVLMGSGEPMDNYDNVVRFIKLITSAEGLCISRRNITVSTCGLVPQMKQFADEDLGVTLALSLHAPNDEKRKELMPVAKSFCLTDVMEACRYYFEKTGRRVTYEYSLVAGVNDSLDCAMELADLVSGFPGHVNLIPVNPVKERSYRQSGRGQIRAFTECLKKRGLAVTVRREMGRDIDGACGQLRRSYMEGNGVIGADRGEE